MKKAFIDLLNGEDSTLRINKFCTIHRWTKDALGNPVDKLEVTFSITSAFSHSYVIDSREWRSVVSEIQRFQTKAFADAAETLNRHLANGYIG